MDTTFVYLRDCLLYAAMGAIGVCPLLFLNLRIAPKLGLLDWPKARGLTEVQIPLIGHSLVAASIGAILVLMRFYPISPWFLTTALIMAVMGHFDDRRPLSALDKIFFQIVCVGCMVFLDPQIRASMVDRYGTAGALWAMFFILGLMNAVNFIDGIDGLAGLIIAIGCAGFLLLARGYPGQHSYMIYAALLFGMTFPFLWLNVKSQRGFLGNVGSYFFSYVLAVMHLSLPLDAAGPVSRLSISGLCFLVPVADAIVVILTRLLTGRSPFNADKGHLHHRLIQASLPLRSILAYFSVIEISSAVVAFLIARDPAVRRSVLPIAFGLSQIGIASLLILLCDKASKRRVQCYFQRLDAGEPIYFFKYRISNPDGSAIGRKTLARLEARVSAEIRVTDLCFMQAPDQLFVTLRTMSEPLRGISSRLDAIFQAEHVHNTLVVDKGEFIKVSEPLPLQRVPHRKIA